MKFPDAGHADVYLWCVYSQGQITHLMILQMALLPAL